MMVLLYTVQLSLTMKLLSYLPESAPLFNYSLLFSLLLSSWVKPRVWKCWPYCDKTTGLYKMCLPSQTVWQTNSDRQTDRQTDRQCGSQTDSENQCLTCTTKRFPVFFPTVTTCRTIKTTTTIKGSSCLVFAEVQATNAEHKLWELTLLHLNVTCSTWTCSVNRKKWNRCWAL